MGEGGFTPNVGKVPRSFLSRALVGKLGAVRSEVLHGPKFGVDTGIIRLGDGTVGVFTTDPISIIPSIGLENSAWLSVHSLASDITTSGLPPAFATFSLNLPPEIEDAEIETYWNGIHRACEELGVAVVRGHTGRFVGCNYTIVGAGTMIAIGSEKKFLTSSMARLGDEILLTKGAAISTTGILAHAFPNIIRQELGEEVLKSSQTFLRNSSTVNDALTAAAVGVRDEGVTAMHDVTEGGIIAALYELASSSGKTARVELGSIGIAKETARICRLFQIDPLSSLGEGALVISVGAHQTHAVRKALQARGIESFLVGGIEKSNDKAPLIDSDGRSIEYPKRDLYWDAYWGAIRKGWT
jgi:hydrogenase maturation factor